MTIDKPTKWEQLHGYFTPGGDPVFRCFNCGGDEHLYGIESLGNYHHKCKDCGADMMYPWEGMQYD